LFLRTTAIRGPAQILEGWQKVADARLWKLIVSPEFGDRMSLDDLTCDSMRRMEQDLGTKLEWTAVPHFNTEHPI
jgi:type IV secretory pathway VirD2 relaxase